MSAVLDSRPDPGPGKIRKISSMEAPSKLVQEGEPQSSWEERMKVPGRRTSVAPRKTSTGRKISMVGAQDWNRKMSAESSQRRMSAASRADSDVQRKVSEKARKISKYVRENTEDNTLKFVYSEAVERSIRSRFRSSAFPPISRVGRGIESRCEIPKLPEIFDDWVLVRKCRKKNVSGERSWKTKEDRRRSTIFEDEDSISNRLPRLQHLKLMRMNRKRSSVAPGTSKLPPVLQVSREASPSGNDRRTSQSDFNSTV